METGGAQVLAVDLMNEMANNHEVSLIIVNNKWNDRLLCQLNKNVKIHYINRKEGSMNPLPILKFNLILLKLRPDIIHCHEPNMIAAIKIPWFKTIYTIHDVGIQSEHDSRYNSLVAISNAVYTDASANRELKINIVFNGIPVKLFKKRTSYELRHDEPLKLVQVSRLMHEKKGQHLLLKALSQLTDVNFIMDFVGSGDSLEYLQTISKEMGLSGKIRFLGEKDREWIFNQLNTYHLLIQPSLYEGFGLTIVEGLAAGLPVLVSNIEGPAEIVSNTHGGFLFESGSAISCVQQLKNIFELYHLEKIDKLMQSTASLLKQYSIEHASEKYLQEYQK